MSLLLKKELRACCGGAPPASRNNIPAVQLLVTKLFKKIVLSVWLRKIKPVLLKSMMLLWMLFPLLLLTSIPVRFPVNLENLTSTVLVIPCTAIPAVFNPGLFQSVVLFPSRVIVIPSRITPAANTWNVEPPAPPIGPLTVVERRPEPRTVTCLFTRTSLLNEPGPTFTIHPADAASTPRCMFEIEVTGLAKLLTVT